MHLSEEPVNKDGVKEPTQEFVVCAKEEQFLNVQIKLKTTKIVLWILLMLVVWLNGNGEEPLLEHVLAVQSLNKHVQITIVTGNPFVDVVVHVLEQHVKQEQQLVVKPK